MPSQKNIDQVNELTEKLSQAKAVILTDYTGLSVSKQAELRQKVKDAGGQFLVAKNRLFKLALSEMRKSALPHDVEDVLQGPTAFLFAFEDEIAPIKSLIEFADQFELPKTKIGLLFKPEDRLLTVEEIEKLAKLPTHAELIARLIGTLNAPKLRFVNVLSGNLTKLVLIIKEIQKSKKTN
jgi:large subunit ribosomal protein L10